MATNWLQLDSPFEAYSDLVCLTILSKSMRGTNLSIWLNMLHDALTVGLPRCGSDEFRRSPAPYTVGWPIVISRLGQEWSRASSPGWTFPSSVERPLLSKTRYDDGP